MSVPSPPFSTHEAGSIKARSASASAAISASSAARSFTGKLRVGCIAGSITRTRSSSSATVYSRPSFLSPAASAAPTVGVLRGLLCRQHDGGFGAGPHEGQGIGLERDRDRREILKELQEVGQRRAGGLDPQRIGQTGRDVDRARRGPRQRGFFGGGRHGIGSVAASGSSVAAGASSPAIRRSNFASGSFGLAGFTSGCGGSAMPIGSGSTAGIGMGIGGIGSGGIGSTAGIGVTLAAGFSGTGGGGFVAGVVVGVARTIEGFVAGVVGCWSVPAWAIARGSSRKNWIMPTTTASASTIPATTEPPIITQ